MRGDVITKESIPRNHANINGRIMATINQIVLIEAAAANQLSLVT